MAMNNLNTMITALQGLLEKRKSNKTKQWWENYLKHVIQFRGVSMKNIRSSLHLWYTEHNINEDFSPEKQIDLAFALFEEKFAEDKLAGILFFQEILLPQNSVDWKRELPRFAEIFNNNLIYDWNLCDWFCVRILSKLIKKEGKPCALAIHDWKNSSTLWQRRASIVGFANLAKYGEKNFIGFSQMLLDGCSVLIKENERFAKTGVGWVLRELSLASKAIVFDFMITHMDYFSGESLNNAMKKFTNQDKIKIKALFNKR